MTIAIWMAVVASVPWPTGRAPNDDELIRLVSEADADYSSDRREELASALEDQQDYEIVALLPKDLPVSDIALRVHRNYGRELFNFEFPRRLGHGGVITGPRLRRVHQLGLGGLDNFSCAGCHSQGGTDGSGTYAENALVDGDGVHSSSANVRNPPALLGVGFVQQLAEEMTRDLAAQKGRAEKEARRSRADVEARLVTKGVSFGVLIARAKGGVDASRVRGVDADLVVRPFGWKGTEARLRRQLEDAARIHFGVQSTALSLAHREHRDPRLGDGSNPFDPDGDRVSRELEDGIVTATAVYLAMLETPVILPPSTPDLLDRWAKGSELFDQVGCSHCHVRALPLADARWLEHYDTTSTPPVAVDLLRDGDAPRGTDRVMLFSDLKRHDMGDELADRNDSPSGVAKNEFLTRPLWGLAETAPYLHDGRAPTIPDAIALHAGEASEARTAFDRLPAEDRANLHVFLLSLTRTPKPRVAR